MHPLHLTRPRAVAALTAIAVGLFGACTSDTASPTAAVQPDMASHGSHSHNGDIKLTPAMLQAIAQVRQETAKFHNFDVAHGAGYNEQFPPGCAESPDGAQAFHWINRGLVDDKVELLHPELLMYEPQKDGSLQLIGVDYVVPLTASAEPPTLLGVPFAPIEALGVWALHIWAWRPNPSGMFAMWNPKVSCANAR